MGGLVKKNVPIEQWVVRVGRATWLGVGKAPEAIWDLKSWYADPWLDNGDILSPAAKISNGFNLPLRVV